MSLREEMRKYEHTSENCISREASKAFLYERLDRLNDDELYDIFSRIIDDMYNELPSVTPQPIRWIPCSEGLPEDYIHVLCQFTLGGMGECYLAHGVFHVVGGLVMTCNEVIAWMPLPGPYKAQKKECADCKHYGKLSLDCGRCDDNCSMFAPQESEE